MSCIYSPFIVLIIKRVGDDTGDQGIADSSWLELLRVEVTRYTRHSFPSIDTNTAAAPLFGGFSGPMLVFFFLDFFWVESNNLEIHNHRMGQQCR
jgi:hypothetical protein